MTARYPLAVRVAAPMIAALLVAGCGAASAEEVPATPDRQITATGVGRVKLGRTYGALHSARLLGKVGPGCELEGPNARSAPLRAPLKGSVDLTEASPRKVRTVVITGGAAARGVSIGSKAEAIRAAFPRARADHRTDSVFGITIHRVPKRGGGRLEFAVDTDSERVTMIGVPAIPFCD